MRMDRLSKVIILSCCIFSCLFFCVSLCWAWGWGYSGQNPSLYRLKIGNTYSLKERFPHWPGIRCRQMTDLRFEIIKPEEREEAQSPLHKCEPIPSPNWIDLEESYYSEVKPNEEISPNITIRIPDDARYQGKSYWAKLKAFKIVNGKEVDEREWEIYIHISCDPKEILPIYQEGNRILKEAERFKKAHEYSDAIERFNEYLAFYRKNEKKIKSVRYAILPEEVKPLFPLLESDEIEAEIEKCKELSLIPKSAWNEVEREGFSEALFEAYIKFLGIDGYRSPHYYEYEEIYRFDSFKGPQFISALLKRTKETNNPVLKYRLIEKLGDVGDESAVEFLREIVKDKESPAPVRWYAVEALGKLKDKGSVDLLTAALYDEIIGVRLHAARALGEIGDESALPALREALTNIKDAALIRYINKAISEITGEDFEYINYGLRISLRIPTDWEVSWFPWEENQIYIEIKGPEVSGTYANMRIRKEKRVCLIEEVRELRRKEEHEPTFNIPYPIGEEVKINELWGVRSFRVREAGQRWKFKNFKEMGVILFLDGEQYFIECSAPEEAFEDLLPQFEKIIETFKPINIEDVSILESVSIDATRRWREWLNQRFKSISETQLIHKERLEDKLKKLVGKDRSQFFSDINNDGKIEALIVCPGTRPKWAPEIQMISALIIMGYEEEKQDWEELVRLDEDGFFIKGERIPYILAGEEYQFTLGIDKNRNLYLGFMVGGPSSDEGVIHWKPFKKTYCDDVAGSGCDDF
ncbi:TPA: hypothetical protein DCX15_01370 [bacterium]|nr:hypothetical protein [bacterium]